MGSDRARSGAADYGAEFISARHLSFAKHSARPRHPETARLGGNEFSAGIHAL